MRDMHVYSYVALQCSVTGKNIIQNIHQFEECLCMRTMHSKVSVVDRVAIKRLALRLFFHYNTEAKKLDKTSSLANVSLS